MTRAVKVTVGPVLTHGVRSSRRQPQASDPLPCCHGSEGARPAAAGRGRPERSWEAALRCLLMEPVRLASTPGVVSGHRAADPIPNCHGSAGAWPPGAVPGHPALSWETRPRCFEPEVAHSPVLTHVTHVYRRRQPKAPVRLDCGSPGAWSAGAGHGRPARSRGTALRGAADRRAESTTEPRPLGSGRRIP